MAEHEVKCSIAGCNDTASVAIDIFSKSDNKLVTLYLCQKHFNSLVQKAYRRGYLSTFDLVAVKVDGGYEIKFKRRARAVTITGGKIPVAKGPSL